MADAASPVAADGDAGAGGRRRADRRPSGRPRWWAVLAVSLALMALVAAVSRSSPPHPLPASASGPHHPTRAPATAGGTIGTSASRQVTASHPVAGPGTPT
ncbi:MAG: hypothetical protein ACRDY3_04775, partial [Acidimicrobiales bacterium]